MKRLLCWILCVVVALIAIDCCVGVVSRRYVAGHDLGGDYTSLTHLLRDFDEDGLILGSSVALNALDAKRMSDSLGMSFFNGASNGQTLPYFLTMAQTVSRLHCPKLILLGLHYEDFNSVGMGNRYNFLAPYYGLGYAEIDSGLSNISPEAKYLMKSNLYRFNNIWFRILLYRFITPGEVGENGFIAKPIPSQFPSMQTITEYKDVTAERVAQFEKIVSLCRANNIRLMVFIPPKYYRYATHPKARIVLDSICKRHGVTVYNDIQHPRFVSDSTLFYDNGHLNCNGAEIYTDTLINRLRACLITK